MSDNIWKVALTLPAITVKGFGYTEDDLKRRNPLVIVDESHYYEHLRKMSDDYPFLSIMGLRLITEIKIKRILENKGIKYGERDTLGGLIKKLPVDFPNGQRKVLEDFCEFENSASHGYEIEKRIACWALEAIPDFLRKIRE